MKDTFTNLFNQTSVLINDVEREIIMTVNVAVLCSVVGLFGTMTNVVNIVVFYRQGLDTTINISFFSVAVSDLCGLVFQLFYSLFVNPLVVSAKLPIVYSEVQFVTTGVPREMFAQITCLITAFITAERCLCVVFPLHVKRMITPKITISVIVVIYIFTAIFSVPLYGTWHLSWKILIGSNTSLLGLAFIENHEVAGAVAYIEHALSTFIGFLSVVIFTLVLIYKLGQKNEWRRTANAEKSKHLSKRERATINMVVLIAGILVVCYTPAVLLSLAMFLEPTFSLTGRHYNLLLSLWSLALLLEVVNSSINIFLYYRMSSKYRQTCNQLFFSRLCVDKLDA